MPIEAVARHATSVDAAADAVQTAHGAAQQVNLGQEAYGKLCGVVLPAMIGILGGSGVKALEASLNSLRDAAAGLRTAAASAESTDQVSASRSRAVAPRRELPL
ncbi:hypothetical protein O7626_28100 [Micromonospora sp. WMMD1102]|uniref:hypothetical protein n=1 Tax=Micromonospora sp. WMMD1102 TaxID=3016105 RepID=UPI002414F0BA|nr:hypothetical protein [Micromonospora sp. WMMD1102]MDG4789743.1 hypothetical protein [Micromonospora sp. WMMD1102]